MLQKSNLDLLFLGSGNAFAAQGRAFSSFLLNGRYLFDAGPTVLQQLKRAEVPTGDIDAILISHYHGDHFFGMPFLLLDCWREGRTRDLWIAGPPGIGERTEELFELAFPQLPAMARSFKRCYVEVGDGYEGEAGGLPFTAAEVDHVPSLRCFSYQAHSGGRKLLYSGDASMCQGLMRLVPGSEVLVLECSCNSDPVHLRPEDIREIHGQADAGAQIILTHLDATPGKDLGGFLEASDLSRFRL